MGKIIYNGRSYSGLIQANGCFIDTNNVIVAKTTYSSSSGLTYTATEDCCICVELISRGNAYPTITIDGAWIGVQYQDNITQQTTHQFFLKKGQIFKVSASISDTVSYVVYGIQQGSPITIIPDYASACYSTQEREIGCWTDGKPLYQKTWTGLNVTPSYNSWSNVIPNDVNIETLVGWQALSNGDYKNLDGTGIEWQVYGGYVRAEYNQNSNVRTIEILTLQYTKTTDVAGSGTWTPLGKPTVHYSTDEQVIGTWIDGKPLYQRTFSSNTILSDNTWANNILGTHGSGITIKKFSGIVKSSVGSVDYNYFRSTTEFFTSMIVADEDDLSVRPNLGFGVPIYQGDVTIQYTKTTD